MTLTETAARISAHLKRFEADDGINRSKRQGAYLGTKPYYGAGAIRSGRFVGVKYVSYQGRYNLKRDEAEAYLAWLDDGNVGRHFEFQRAKERRTEADTKS